MSAELALGGWISSKGSLLKNIREIKKIKTKNPKQKKER
ncbi:hypothetical protein LEP1GSC029_1778 [Leptospira interrogans str. 2002000626]|nr:hypothetical protein LEP1GSC029_1778 [Leptospira interrogans str. 2002000626]